MQAGDRDEFEEQLAILCAGFNLPVTAHRKHAYFAGLAKMSLAQFARCVEYALTDDGPDELPTSKGIWRLHHELQRPRANVPTLPPKEDPDHLEYFANRLMLDVWFDRGWFGSVGTFKPAYGMVDCKASPLLLTLLGEKRRVVDWYMGPVRERDPLATPVAFVREFERAFGKHLEISANVRRRWDAFCEIPVHSGPFPAYMARELIPSLRSETLEIA
jgi:hypothetical protein